MFTASEKRHSAHAFNMVQNACTPDSLGEVREALVDLMTLTAEYRKLMIRVADACAAATKTQFNAKGFRKELDAHVEAFLDPIFEALPVDEPTPYGYDPAENSLTYAELV